MHLRSRSTLAEDLRHKAILQIGETGALLEVVLGQKHIPQTEFLSLLLQVFYDGRVGAEALLDGGAELLVEDEVGGDAFFFDELLDLLFASWLVS
jgi:hypothetical protein